MLIFVGGTTPACGAAARALQEAGVALIDHPAPEITHLLLDVPSFAADGRLRGGGDVTELLRRLPPEITVVGGLLTHPALAGYRTLDLLRLEEYIAVNAALTAQAALALAMERLDISLDRCPAVVVGWGRIGKCLARMLKNLGAEVTVAARNPKDRAMLQALGYGSVAPEALDALAPGTRLLVNTVPAPILDGPQLRSWKDCLKIDLASQRGLLGEDVLWARGLPGQRLCVSSGALIARTILKEERP